MLEVDDRTLHVEEQPASVSGLRSQMQRIRQQQAPAGQSVQLAVGDRVQDAVFGEGTVLRAEPIAGDYLLEVAFDTVGTKKLMAKYRKLRKL